MAEPSQALRIKQNYEAVTRQIHDAANGREVCLVCVTKYARLEWVADLIAAGATNIAENMLPDAVERFDTLHEQGLSFTAHLIGPQQSRKLSLIPGKFDWFQAMDSEKTAEKLNSRLQAAGETISALLQVNIAAEPQKSGVQADQAEQAFGRICESCEAIKLRGLMAIPPWPSAYAGPREFEKNTRQYFRQMRNLFDRISSQYQDRAVIDTLSLGMSQDFVWAIEEGASMVRVGSALFDGLEG